MLVRLWYVLVGIGFLVYVTVVVIYFKPPGLRILGGDVPRPASAVRMEALSLPGGPASSFEAAAAAKAGRKKIRGVRAANIAAGGYGAEGSVHGVVILGMHRSGTSMVTGLLERMGLKLGPPETLLGGVAGENDKGFFERVEVIHENDNLMRRQDVNWALNVFKFDHLRALDDMLDGRVDFTEGRHVLDYFRDPANQPWALKDPRLCITLRFWLPLWDTPPSAVLIYRHPIEVAKSLVRRREFGLPRGLHLWIAYNRLAVQNSQGLCRVVANNADLMSEPVEQMARIRDELRRCGVAVPGAASRSDVEEFVDPGLRHHNKVRRDEDGVNLECEGPEAWHTKEWVSDLGAVKGSHEYHREASAVAHAMRVFCALEDGSAFRPDFVWEDLPDFAPP